jgi:tetratricopeptide (TPR) repeat protein
MVATPLMSKRAGNSGDEDGFQVPQGQNVINYYKTDGKDTTCLNYKDVMQYYGSSFDVVTEYINSTFHIEDISKSRHICNSLLGWMAIVAVGLIAYLVGGARAGVFALLLLFLSPRFLGHSFNNPKDIPFAAGVIWSIYGMMLFFKQFPKVKWYTYLILVLSIAFAISVRIGGLILFGYFGLLGLMFLIKVLMERRKSSKTKLKKQQTQEMPLAKYLLKLILSAVAICVVGYFAGLLLWPYAMQSPIKNPIESFKAMSTFATSLRQLFEGTMQWSDYLPWYYTPKYILISIPIAVILGVILFFVFCWRKKADRFWAFFIFFTFFFPVFWIVFTKANVYGGWRHAMFAYPPMVAAAGWGFDALVRWVEAKLGIKNGELRMENGDANDGGDGARPVSTKGIIVNVASVVILLALLIGPIRHIVANHPYEYVYFNELAGGTKKAFSQYELDYYYHSTREASEWVIANAEPKADGSKIRVGTWHLASVNYFFRHDTARFQPTFIRWYEKENTDWDYAIFTITGISPEYLRSPYFPPKNTVKTIDVDGVPICIILKRQDKNDFLAAQMKNDNTKLDSAIALYHQALAVDPDNIGALLGIGECYVRTNRPDSALLYLNRYHKIDPEAEMANYMRAYAYVYKQDVKTALDILLNIEEQNPKYAGAYQLAIQLYLQQRDFANAKKQFVKVMDVDRFDESFVQLWLQYNQMQNIDQNTAYRQLYKSMAKSYEKRGKKEEAARFRELAGIKSK